MKLNGYRVEVSDHRENSDGYVNIKHGTEYSLELTNSNNLRCIAEVEIDGKNVGNFVLSAYESICIERPTNEARKFVALVKGTSEFTDAELKNVSNEQLGLIQVKFKPEKPRIRRSIIKPYSRDENITLCSTNAVGTGLGSESDQSFTTVSGFATDTPTTIYLRLVSKSITPLRSTTTKYPRPV